MEDGPKDRDEADALPWRGFSTLFLALCTVMGELGTATSHGVPWP